MLALDLALVALRSSLLNTRLPRLLNLREGRESPVDRAAALIERPRLRISLRLAGVLCHFLLAITVWLLFASGALPPFALYQVLIGLILAGLALMLLEFSVEGRALRNPEEWAIHLASFGQVVDALLSPLSLLALAIIGYPLDQNALGPVTEDELRTWVEEGQTSGSLEKEERQMIYSIFQFRDTLAREIMVPRIDVAALEINTPLSEAIGVMSRTGHSRVPVFEETIDNIVGFLYAKDLLTVDRSPDSPLSSMRSILRPAYFVPEAKRVDELLTEMQTRRVHVAVVVDEYGGVAGMVTLEDITEEIIGEIQDEYDQAEEMLYQKVGPDEYIFQGRISMDDFNEIMGSHLTQENAETLGGFIYGEMGRVPAGGESVETNGLVLTVEQVIGRRIRKVRARCIHPDVEMEAQEANADK